jgi:methionine-R-sulfoxide reductase
LRVTLAVTLTVVTPMAAYAQGATHVISRPERLQPNTVAHVRYSIIWIMMLKWPDVLHLAKEGNPSPDRKVVKTDAEWRQQLSPEEYRVTRQAGTERPFSSQMCNFFEPGIYFCLCCETVLFDASEKFESGTGWPSFTQPVALNAIAYRFDGPAFLKRVETVCNTCDAHLGHVFPDGPPPSGLRYCMNAVALKKVPTQYAQARPR